MLQKYRKSFFIFYFSGKNIIFVHYLFDLKVTQRNYTKWQICSEHEVANGVFGLHFVVYLYFPTFAAQEAKMR